MEASERVRRFVDPGEGGPSTGHATAYLPLHFDKEDLGSFCFVFHGNKANARTSQQVEVLHRFLYEWIDTALPLMDLYLAGRLYTNESVNAMVFVGFEHAILLEKLCKDLGMTRVWTTPRLLTGHPVQMSHHIDMSEAPQPLFHRNRTTR